MKLSRTFVAMALLVLPLAARAQDEASEPPSPQVRGVAAVPVIAGQVQPENTPPPQRILIQKRFFGPEPAPDGATVMLNTNPEPGMGLGAWWKNSEIVSKLQLSDEQVKKISQTYLDHKLRLIDLHADVEKQELRLQPLMDVDQPDQNKVGAQIDMITAARGRLEKENAMMMLDIRRWLSVEQWKKLKSFEGAEEGKRNVFFFRSGGGVGVEGPPPPPLPDDMPVTRAH